MTAIFAEMECHTRPGLRKFGPSDTILAWNFAPSEFYPMSAEPTVSVPFFGILLVGVVVLLVVVCVIAAAAAFSKRKDQ